MRVVSVKSPDDFIVKLLDDESEFACCLEGVVPVSAGDKTPGSVRPEWDQDAISSFGSMVSAQPMTIEVSTVNLC